MSVCEKEIDHLQACKYFRYYKLGKCFIPPNPPRHVSSPLYYCNASEPMWCGYCVCGLWWAAHLLITGLTPCCISATYKETRTFNAGSVFHFQPSVLFCFFSSRCCLGLDCSALLEPSGKSLKCHSSYPQHNRLSLPGSQLEYSFIMRQNTFVFLTFLLSFG